MVIFFSSLEKNLNSIYNLYIKKFLNECMQKLHTNLSIKYVFNLRVTNIIRFAPLKNRKKSKRVLLYENQKIRVCKIKFKYF